MNNWQYFPARKTPQKDKYTLWRENAHRFPKEVRLRLEWLILHETKFYGNVSLTCRHFGIARKTFYHWYHRFQETNLHTLEDESRAPHHPRQPEYTYLEEQYVIKLRQRYPTAGREKLVVLYQEDYGIAIKPWSMRRIVHDRKLYARRAIKTKRVKAQSRILRHKRITELTKQPETGFLVEADTIVIYWANERRYILTAIDYHSRFAFAYMYKSKASKYAADFLRRLLLLFGGNLRNLHIDNGSEFKREFEQAAQELGVELYHARTLPRPR